MDLSLHELRAFLKTTTAGSISKAAKSLGITQPTLSWTIKKLEERFETELFIRTKQGVSLTRSGKVLESRSKELVRQWEGIAQALRDEEQSIQGRYTIGVYPTLAAYALPSFLPKLLAQWPKLNIELAHNASQQIAEGVINFQYDLGIVANAPRHPDLTISDLYQDEVVLWRSKSTTWKTTEAHVPIICNTNMRHVPLILGELETNKLLNQHRLIHTDDLGVVLSLTAAGCGFGILPTTIAEQNPSSGLVTVSQSPQVKDQISLIWRKDTQGSASSKVIRDAIRQGLTPASNR